MKKSFSHMALALLVPAALVGCVNSTIGSTRDWMEEQQRIAVPSVKPIPEPKKYVAVDYQPALGVEPFNFARLAQALNLAAANNSPLLAAENARPKEPLEAYPLDALSYVGMLKKEGKLVGLIRVDNLLYQVRVGQYMGQNYGRVLDITAGEITLREIAQDAAGEWVERKTTLDVQEGAK